MTIANYPGSICRMKLAPSEIVIFFFSTLFPLLLVPVSSDGFRQCGDVRVYFSADNGARLQEIACCMQSPAHCRWVFAGDPQVNVSYREQQTGLVLRWQPGIDLFGRYSCFNQMNGTEEEINFLPAEGAWVLKVQYKATS